MWNVSGSLHNHLIAWKIDFDILGTANSVNMHTIGVQKTQIPGLGIPIWNHRCALPVGARGGWFLSED